MRIFIVFRDTIYVRGLAATLVGAPAVDAVDCAPSIARAWESESLAAADVVVLDGDLGGADGFAREVTAESSARVLLCLHEVMTEQLFTTIGDGVCGAISRDRLTPETLLAAITAVSAGILAFDRGVVRTMTALLAPSRDPDRQASVAGGFAPREQMVLSLVAEGLSNREIAQRLSYSERTIKAVLHDVVVKLGVKSRSEAVAMAVRERMI